MAELVITLPVPNAATLVASYDRVLLYRSTGVNQPFVELTNPAIRPTLLANTVSYTFTDPNGDASYFYAAGLFNTVTGAVSPMGEAVPGSGDASLGILSISDLKLRYLFGLPLTDRRGNPLPDSFFSFYISAAVAGLARDLDICLVPTVVTGETQHYRRPYADRLPLVVYPDLVPVQSVQALRLKLPYSPQPANIPLQWLTVAKDYGSIYLYPQTSLDSFILPINGYVFAGGAWDDWYPNGWQIDYVAGFPRGAIPPDLLDAIGMMAAISPLAIMGDLVLPPGIGSTSLGIDGLSQSVSGKGGYADRINSYLAALAANMSSLRMKYRGSMLRGD